jgi:flavin reductase (DIM6/NTAB) family NADH-FMN oxidoreductase RutF
MIVDPQAISTAQLQGYLQSAVAPRPIAFASTINVAGEVNLSPFSFFNVFSANPPILIFSPARRVTNGTTKHTLDNVLEVPEVVINVVNFALVEQASLASTEYAKGVDEFVKAGLTAAPSLTVRPPRVAESPVSFECSVEQVMPLGTEGGAGNLIICQVRRIHIRDEYLDEQGRLDTERLDLVARMGGNWYTRAAGSALFEIPKPLATRGIGIDQLPLHIQQSTILTGNQRARLGNQEKMPDEALLSRALERAGIGLDLKNKHQLVANLLENGEVELALGVAFLPII